MSDQDKGDDSASGGQAGLTWTITNGQSGANGPVGSNGNAGNSSNGMPVITYSTSGTAQLVPMPRLSDVRYILKQLDGSFWEVIEPQRVKVRDIINLAKLMSVVTYVGLQNLNQIGTQIDWMKLVENLELKDYLVKIDEKTITNDKTSCIFMLHQS